MKTKLSSYVYLFAASIVLTIIGIYIIEGYYQSMFIGAAFGMGFPAFIKIIQHMYYKRPTKQDLFQQKIIKEKIEQTDERLLMLRQKSSSYTIQMFITILLGFSFISALFRFHYSYTILLMTLLILLLIVWYITYKILNKKH